MVFSDSGSGSSKNPNLSKQPVLILIGLVGISIATVFFIVLSVTLGRTAGALFLLGLPVPFTLRFLVVRRQQSATLDAWIRAAGVLGLEVDPSSGSYLRMRGQVRGTSILVEIVDGYADDGARSMRYSVSAEGAAPGAVRFHKEYYRFHGKNFPKIGDPAIDKAASYVEAPNPDAARHFLTPNRRNVVIDVLTSWRTAVISSDVLIVERYKVERDADVIAANVLELVEAITILAGP